MRLLQKVGPSGRLVAYRRLALSSWAVGVQLLHATFVEAGDVRPCAIKSPLEFVSFTQKLVPLGEKVLFLLA